MAWAYYKAFPLALAPFPAFAYSGEKLDFNTRSDFNVKPCYEKISKYWKQVKISHVSGENVHILNREQINHIMPFFWGKRSIVGFVLINE